MSENKHSSPLTKNISTNPSPTLTYGSDYADRDSISKAEGRVEKEWEPGDIILGLYEVIEVLGEGAYCKVYRVHHHGWNTSLAVKSLKEKLAENDIRRRLFVRECEGWVNLDLHPNIATCYYVRELGGIPRIFSEFIPAGNLDNLISSGKIEDWKKILNLSIQCLDGLIYAHKKGLVHRDIKPANCLLTGRGELKITDFGIASGLTRLGIDITGEVKKNVVGTMFFRDGAVGTPAYMPPEQWDGIYGKIGPWSDLYSFGVMLFELCCGQRPFDSGDEDCSILKIRHTTVPPPDPVCINKDIPGFLGNFILRCLEKRIFKRPQSSVKARADLVKIYKKITGEDYPGVPREAELSVDGLNNRAVSMIDMGMVNEAEKILTSLLRKNPSHPQVIYNQGLLLWRRGDITDMDMIMRMEELKKHYPHKSIANYLFGLVHLERDNISSATGELKEALRSEDSDRFFEAERALSIAEDRETVKTRCLKIFEIPSSVSIECLPESDIPVDTSSEAMMHGQYLKSFLDYTVYPLSVCISPDGRFAFSGNSDGTILRWDTSGVKHPLNFDQHHAGPVRSLSISQDGTLLVSGGKDGIARIWNINGRCLKAFKGHVDEITSVAISLNKKIILSGGLDRSICLWDTGTGRCLRIFKYDHNITSLSFSPDEKLILSGNSGNLICLRDTVKGTHIKDFKGHKDVVTYLIFTRDGKYLLSAGLDKIIYLWDLEKSDPLKIFRGHTSGILSLSISSEGGYFLSCGKDKTLRMWNTVTGQCLRTFKEHRETVSSVCMSSSETLGLSGSYDGTLRLWKLTKGYTAPFILVRPVSSAEAIDYAETFESILKEAEEALKTGATKKGVSLIEKARALPGYGHSERLLDLLQRAGRKGIKRGLKRGWMVKEFEGESGFSALSFLPDSNTFLSGGHDGQLHMWNINSIKPLKTFSGHTMGIASIYISDDGKTARTAGYDKTIRLWNLETGECRGIFSPFPGNINSMCFLPDGCLAIASNSENNIILSDLYRGKTLRTFHGNPHPVSFLCVSSDGRFALSGSFDEILRYWDIEKGECVRAFKVHTGIISRLAISPDNKLLLLAAKEDFHLLDMDEGKCLRTFKGHSETVEAMCFSPDGRFALSGSWDRTLCLWDLEKGECIRNFELHTGWINSVCFSPDGNLALSGGGYDDKKICLWRFEWDYEFPEPADWDEGARPYVEIFLRLHPQIKNPINSIISYFDIDLTKLMEQLSSAGYGWLRPEGVRREMKKMK